jgi:hypothetical protein
VDCDEEAGLRAFAVTVGAYAGASYPERPLWVERDGVRVEVASVDARWREEERVGFRVRLADGSAWLLYYVPELDLWSGVANGAGGAGAVGGAAPAPSRRSESPRDAGTL